MRWRALGHNAKPMSNSHPPIAQEDGSPGEIALAFLKLGFTAFGGPAAHIAMMEDEFVRRRQWLSHEEFLDRMGAVGLLPGPSSTELAIYLGQLRGGFVGLLLAGACFIFPAAILAAGLAWVYVRYGAMPEVSSVLLGVKPVVVVLIAQAIWSLGKTALKSRELIVLSVVVLFLATRNISPIALLIGTGIAWIVANRFGAAASRGAAAILLEAGGAVSGAAISTASVFLYFLKVGAVLFGSGYVLLALLRADLVQRLHWLTDAQLLDAVAVSQATPGPFFTVATFVGYLLGGWKGAGVATAGMFLPAFLFVAATASILPRLRKSPTASAFLDGVNAAAIALMAYVGFQFAKPVFAGISSVVIAAIAVVLLFRFRVNSAWLVLGGAAAGLLLHFTHLI